MSSDFFIKLDSNNLNEISIFDQLPDIVVPRKIRQENDRYLLTGYFVSYDGLSLDELLIDVTAHGFKNLVNGNNEFLLFLFDKHEMELKVCVDQFYSFACYFSVSGNSIIFSNNFAKLKNDIQQAQRLIGDWDMILTGLLWTWHATERTLIQQIKVVPPGSILEINFSKPEDYKITSLVDIDAFLGEAEGYSYSSMSEFAHDWLDAVKEIVRRRWSEIPRGTNVGCDISSGFDCTLIAYCLSQIAGPNAFTCYSQYSDLVREESDIKIVKKFLDKHGISKLNVIDTSERHLYVFDHEREWSVDDPYQIASDRQQLYLRMLKEDEVRVNFTGEGGDESYRLKNIELAKRFRKQYNYFMEVEILRKYGAERLFTPKGVEIFLEWRRFNSRKLYSTIVSESGVIGTACSFEQYNANGIRKVHPFQDTRLIALGKQMPEVPGKKKWELKLELMEELKDEVFLDEMFIEKGSREYTFANFARNQKPLIEKVLNNSVLAGTGLIDPKYIWEMVNNEGSEVYKTPDVAIALETLVKLEWFLQKNEIVIK